MYFHPLAGGSRGRGGRPRGIDDAGKLAEHASSPRLRLCGVFARISRSRTDTSAKGRGFSLRRPIGVRFPDPGLAARAECAPRVCRGETTYRPAHPLPEQDALADLLASGAYERYVRGMRKRNAERRAVLLQALADELGPAVTIMGAETGLHVVAWLNGVAAEREAAFIAAARSAGIGLYPVSQPAPTTARLSAGAASTFMSTRARPTRRSRSTTGIITISSTISGRRRCLPT